MKWVAALLIVVALSGCFKGTPEARSEEGPTADDVDAIDDQMFGWVLSPDVAPIEGAKVSINSEGLESITTAEGLYIFNDLPFDVPLTVSVQADGFVTASKSVTIPLDSRLVLNFTLARVPQVTPRVETQSFQGFLSCHATVKVSDDTQKYDCGGINPQTATNWTFTVGPGTVAIVLEMVWTKGTEAAHDLRMQAITLGFGELNEELFLVEGPSTLRGDIGRIPSERFYTGQGGSLQVNVDSGAEIDDEEVGVGGGVAFQQDFQIFASVFYHEGPDPTYSIQNV